MFSCKFCCHHTEKFQSHLNHYQYHSNVTRYFHCDYNDCQLFFKTEQALRMHIKRSHKVKLKCKILSNAIFLSKNSDARFVCTDNICQQKFLNYDQYLKHLKDHINEGLKVKCPINNCDKKYDNVQSFTGHLSRCRRINNKKNFEFNFNSIEISPMNNTNSSVVENDGDDNLIDSDNANSYDIAALSCEDKNDLFLINLASLYLKLESQYLVPASTIQYFVSELNNIIAQSREITNEIFRNYLTSIDISPDQIDSLINQATESDPFLKSNKLLGTKYLRNQFYKKKFAFVTPERIVIEEKKGKAEIFHYVPILETIKANYHNKFFKNSLDVPSQDVPYVLQDFTDGSVYRENAFFNANPKAFKVILFQDSFGIVNPLASTQKKYKMLAVYMSLGNLPDYLRTHINSIHLVALCRESQFNHAKVYGRIVSDLQKLENEGVELSPNTFRKGGLAFIAGDNLGSNSLGGFVENFSSTPYFCRYCFYKHNEHKVRNKKSLNSTRKIPNHKLKNKVIIINKKKSVNITKKYKTKNEVKKYTKASTFNEYIRKDYPRRTIESYNESIQKVSEDDNLKSHYGVKFDSEFNKLKSFHVCSPGLPPCLGHDLMEGVIAYDLHLFIKQLIKKRWFTCTELNSRIDLFNYSPQDSRDKPIKFQLTGHKIAGGAWQIWCFFKYFPLIISDKIIDPHDPIWLAVLTLLEIVELVCAPKIDERLLPYLQDLIDEYLSDRVYLFPTISLRAKHHFLSHYSELILKFGPLMNVWTLRFESKHSFFKRVIRAIHNFLNVTHSLSEKHELLQCLLRMGADLKPPVTIENAIPFDINMYSNPIQEAIINAKLPLNIELSSSVTLKGTSYTNGQAVVIRQQTYQYQVEIGKIVLILSDEVQNIYFVVEKSITVFNPVIRFYELRPTELYECINARNLLIHTPLWIYQLNVIKGVKLPYAIAFQ